MYYLGVFIFLLLLQLIVRPMVNESRIEEVSFSKFQQMIQEDQVTKVQQSATGYTFEVKDAEGMTRTMKTGPWQTDLTPLLERKGIEFSAEIPTTPNPILAFLLTFVLPLGLLWWMGRRIIMQMQGSGAMSFGKSNAKVYVKAKSGKSFADVAGQDEAKESLTEVVDFLSNPQKYEEIGAVSPKGVLLVGPPGTGKTLLAQAVAGEAHVPFFSMSGSEFVELFVGMGAAKVRDLFKEAKKKAPCIVFIDEIDAIGKKRDGTGLGGNDEREQTLNQLLSEMDGFEGNTGVVILAATNRPEILDRALIRPGRFDRQVRVELPDIRGREAILRVHAKKVKTDGRIDFRQVARMTAGTSGADLANIVNEGALRAVRERRTGVTTEDLIESVETVIAGQQKKNAVITTRDKEIIAYHEVGHALVAAIQKETAPVTKITIIPRTSGALGYTMQVDEEEKVIMTREDIFKEIATLSGGRGAEELIFHTKTTGASNDIERATKMARAMVTRFGMSETFDFMALETQTNQYLGGDAQLAAADETAGEVDDLVAKILKDAHDTAIAILKENEVQLHKIARFLLDQETITGEQFMTILNESLVENGREPIQIANEAEMNKEAEPLEGELQPSAEEPAASSTAQPQKKTDSELVQEALEERLRREEARDE
ncbi:MAG: ATP-dependent zinc metalloprotease FtsH [Peptoniphilaceae bacterium]|nr:ATP-dependent zinc metalloprotease FtsH [Peptoniphilaceae bacterium]MDY6086236.1 ATP-dependent zinc metalloprotease FtsH [Peptoniphilaceae bacterium]